MKSALVFLALVTLSQAGVPMTRDFNGRVINGQDAKVGEIPYQVSLQYRSNDFHFCGGSVLNENYVITAAHCVQGTAPYMIKVIAGSVSLNKPKSVHFVAEIISHRQYNPYNSWINDIALIKVEVPFEVSDILSYVQLPKPGQDIPAGAVAVVSGWGRLSQGGLSPIELQRADITIVDQDYCVKVYNTIGYNIHDSHLCAHDPVEETGSCHGDSGGPLTVDDKLVGLVSWANGCASVQYPTVYTRVSEYIDWINENAV